MAQGDILYFRGQPLVVAGKDDSDFPWIRFYVGKIVGDEKVLNRLAALTALMPEDEEDLDFEAYEAACEVSDVNPNDETLWSFRREGQSKKGAVFGVHYFPDTQFIALRPA